MTEYQKARQQQWESYQRYRRLQLGSRESPRLFLQEDPQICFGPGYRVSSQALYTRYVDWCQQQGFPPKTKKALCSYLTRSSDLYQIRGSTNIPVGNGKRLRGFIGMMLRQDDTDTE